MNLNDLTAADCPLLPEPGLLEAYNRVAARLRELRDKDPQFFASREVQAVVEKMVGGGKADAAVDSSGKLLGTHKLPLRSLFTRSRYSVGFLGLSNAGKSTTLNRILGYTEKDPEEVKPAREGGNMKPTTSLVTRIHPPQAGETVTAPRFVLRYMTRPEYEAKRDGLARVLGLDPDEGEAALAAAVRTRVQQAETARNTDLADNLRSLQELLAAGTSHGHVLHDADPPHEDTGIRYEDRPSILNHTPGKAAPVPAPLLREADLTLPTTAIEPELELVDMPGIGVKMLMDTIGTTYLLHQLDGIFVFIAASAAMTDKNLADCVFQIRKRFDFQLEGRLWLIFSKCDSLTSAHIKPGPDSCLAGISSFLKDVEVPPEQVVFLSGVWQGLTPERIDEKFTEMCGVPDPLEKMGVAPTTPLGSAFRELREDGGLALVKRLIGATVRSAVAAKTRGEVEERLRDARQSLELAEKLRSQAADPRREEQLEAVHQGVHRLLLLLQGRRDVFEPGEAVPDVFAEPGRQLAKDLLGAFETMCKDTPMQRVMGLADVARQHPRYAGRLETGLHTSLSLSVIQSVFDPIGQELRQLPTVPVVAYPLGPAAAWDDLTRADRVDTAWRSGLIPTFVDGQLFRATDGTVHGALTGQSYRDMMLEKIKVTVHQALHALRRRACQHLVEIHAAYAPAK